MRRGFRIGPADRLGSAPAGDAWPRPTPTRPRSSVLCSILAQFLIEALILTSIGGALGVATGAGLAKLIQVLVGIPTAVPAWAIVLSMLSSGGVGLVFGIYPAYRASRLDPVEAMRRD